jgi:RNA polymerase subunit RPABC4/transcription elongation factor Spt4
MDGLMDQVGAAIGAFLDNPIVQLLTAGFVAYVVVLWIASAWWVFHDLRRRHADRVLPYLAAAGVILASPLLFPLAVFVYRIVRPGETLAESRERILTERLEALEAEMTLSCPGCSRLVEEDWLVCPACRTKLAHRCVNCGRTMGLDWTLCGWCGTEFGRPVLPERAPGAVRQAWARDLEARRAERATGARAGGRQRVLEPGA